MTNYQRIISQPQYDFLRDNQLLGDNLILVTLGGSHAYGVHIEGVSDLDVRGVALNPRNEILLGRDFEQVIDTNTDTTIYSFKKIVDLLAKNNPNTIEILGCRADHYLYKSDIGSLLLESKDMFLSKIAYKSFGGYAEAQSRRLYNALARDKYPQEDKERHILGSIFNAMSSFEDRYTKCPTDSIKAYIEDSDRIELDKEIYLDINLKKYPLREFTSMISEMKNVVSDYDKVNNRNSKKDIPHLCKHMMHLVRLYLMAIDIFEKETIKTYRGENLDLLMGIRNGEYLNEDGTVRSEFDEILSYYKGKMDYAFKNTSLPDKPDYKRIEELVMYVTESVVFGRKL